MPVGRGGGQGLLPCVAGRGLLLLLSPISTLVSQSADRTPGTLPHQSQPSWSFPHQSASGSGTPVFTCSHTLTLSGSDTPALHTLPDTLSSVIHHTTLGPKQYSTYNSSTNTTPVVTPPFPRIKHPPMVLNPCTVNTLKHSG